MHVDYLSYWSLRHRPFAEQRFFQGSGQCDVVEGIHRFVVSDDRITTVTGPSRSGVSCLLKYISTMRGLGDCAVDFLLSDARTWKHQNLAQHALVALNLETFRLPTLPQIREILQSNKHQGLKTIWVIDHVNRELSVALHEWSAQCPEMVIITGRSRPLVRAIDDTNSIDLDLLSREDGIWMIERGLEHAGGDPSVFSRSASSRLHEVSQGRIGDMIAIAEYALHQAALNQEPSITSTGIDRIVNIRRSCSA
ncbi:MAG: hypothetical protein AAGG48_24015 [Planctomycetota bacterium]